MNTTRKSLLTIAGMAIIGALLAIALVDGPKSSPTSQPNLPADGQRPDSDISASPSHKREKTVEFRRDQARAVEEREIAREKATFPSTPLSMTAEPTAAAEVQRTNTQETRAQKRDRLSSEARDWIRTQWLPSEFVAWGRGKTIGRFANPPTSLSDSELLAAYNSATVSLSLLYVDYCSELRITEQRIDSIRRDSSKTATQALDQERLARSRDAIFNEFVALLPNLNQLLASGSVEIEVRRLPNQIDAPSRSLVYVMNHVHGKSKTSIDVGNGAWRISFTVDDSVWPSAKLPSIRGQ